MRARTSEAVMNLSLPQAVQRPCGAGDAQTRPFVEQIVANEEQLGRGRLPGCLWWTGRPDRNEERARRAAYAGASRGIENLLRALDVGGDETVLDGVDHHEIYLYGQNVTEFVEEAEIGIH